MSNLERNLNALLILILSGVLLSAFGVQLILKEEPCPLCMLQRIGMIAVGAAAALNIWFGVKMSHYALALISSLFGGLVALRQISLHVCPGFSQFGIPVLGFSLYTWSFIVFVCVLLYVALLLALYNPNEIKIENPPVNNFGKFATVLLLGITVANVITTLMQCGIGVCSE